MKQNEDIRAKAKQKSVYMYEIADALGISEPTFCRWLRKELSVSQKADVLAAIDIIAEQKTLNQAKK